VHIVLIIDDDPAQLQLCRLALLPVPCNVLTAEGSEEGFRMLANFQPDLLILDLLMPQMNGLDMLRAIRLDERLTRMRILVMTAASGLVGKEETALCDSVMTKPFEIHKLRQTVQLLLNMGHAGEPRSSNNPPS